MNTIKGVNLPEVSVDEQEQCYGFSSTINCADKLMLPSKPISFDGPRLTQ